MGLIDAGILTDRIRDVLRELAVGTDWLTGYADGLLAVISLIHEITESQAPEYNGAGRCETEVCDRMTTDSK